MENMKRYLKELSQEELIKVYEVNRKLQEELFTSVYEDNMYSQEYDGKWLLPKEVDNCYKYHDHYNSFYLTLNEYEGVNFLKNINFKELKDYSVASEEDEKLYKKILNYFNHCNYYSDAYLDNLEKLDNLASKILKNIEEYLHEFEDISEDDIITAWTDEYYQERYENCYILDESYMLYEDVSYTRKLA